MLNYIKKQVSPEANLETYEISFNGKIYKYNVEELIEKLPNIERELSDEIRANESNSAITELNSNRGKKLLSETIIMSRYINKKRKLHRQMSLLLDLKDHLTSMKNGQILVDDVFSNEYYVEPIDTVGKIKLGLGFNPSTVEELEFFRGLAFIRIAKLEKKKSSLRFKRICAYSADAVGIPDYHLDIDSEEVSLEYYDCLKVLKEYAANAEEIVSESAEKYAAEWEKVSDLAEVASNFAEYSGYKEFDADTPESEREEFKKGLMKASIGKEFRAIQEDFDAKYHDSILAEAALEDWSNKEKKARRKIVREKLQINRQVLAALARENAIDKKISELNQKCSAYVKKYK